MVVLRPPVEPMLAQARETAPGPGVLPGGLAFEAKFDGYRCLLFTPIRQYPAQHRELCAPCLTEHHEQAQAERAAQRQAQAADRR
ncbi:hypothetical protein [Streptomyces albidochromogenes]|uniref:ATP-dependent DNA ligase n=1 Tax=Streptomyces albidochromogenes TaxID=329524 RepID=A0ABW6FGL0_9ACTN